MKEQDDDLRSFLIVLRRALLMVCSWIEQRYGLDPKVMDPKVNYWRSLDE